MRSTNYPFETQADLEDLNIRLLERKDLDADLWEALIEEYFVKNREVEPGGESGPAIPAKLSEEEEGVLDQLNDVLGKKNDE